MPLELDPARRNELLASIRRFAADELDAELGDLKASLVLDFFLHELGATLYNQGVSDARVHLQKRIEDLPGEVHAEAASYWAKKKGRRP